MYIIDPPKLYRAPDTNIPPTLLTAKPPIILLIANSRIPIKVLCWAPISYISQMQTSPKPTVRASLREPAKDNVLAGVSIIIVHIMPA
jgi:hypothetical protein